MAVTPFMHYKRHGQITDAINRSAHVDHKVIAATVAETFTVPTDATVVVLASNVDFYVDWHGETAAVPAGDVSDGTGVELNPSVRAIGGLTSFSVISASNGIVTAAWYGG
ncbi:hypothetical protein CMI37_08930 [Candidatus Pacearchaeota archaeon]|nr:hypothetical protein [Candidatus Pacearchaeota archaeon]